MTLKRHVIAQGMLKTSLSSTPLLIISRKAASNKIEVFMNEEELKKDQLPQILHVKDLQVLLSISHNTAYELVRSGKIRSIRIGRTYKIPLDAFNEYLRNG